MYGEKEEKKEKLANRKGIRRRAGNHKIQKSERKRKTEVSEEVLVDFNFLPFLLPQAPSCFAVVTDPYFSVSLLP